jgi:hypothetical protein
MTNVLLMIFSAMHSTIQGLPKAIFATPTPRPGTGHAIGLRRKAFRFEDSVKIGLSPIQKILA